MENNLEFSTPFVVLVLFFITGSCYSIQTDCYPFSFNPDDAATYTWDVNGLWDIYPCPPGTVWDQEVCVCSHNPTIYCQQGVPTDPTHSTDITQLTQSCRNKHYNLVWSVHLCQCVWKRKPTNLDPEYDPVKCEIVLHIQFNHNPPSDTSHLFIQSSRPQLIEVITDYEAEDWLATYLPDSPLTVPVLRGNDLSDAFRINVRFKVDRIPYLENKFQMVFSNGCPEHTANISLSYRVSDQRYRVQFLNDHLTTDIVDCVYDAGSAHSWKSVAVVLQDSRVHLFVNNKLCGSPVNATVETIAKFGCAFTIGGGAIGDGDGPFVGYFDNLIMVRRCKVPIPTH